MVVPYAHVGSLDKLDVEVLSDVMETIKQSITVIDAVYEPEGYNIGANLGDIAGAGITDHVHFHVVPRWGGDTNFMTATADVRVLPEDLGETHRRVKEAWPK
jgi:ATP adenylyltransferase